MSIKKEIGQCMTALDHNDGVLTARFIFPEEFIGFQGHFPTEKILPGVCHIQCATTMIEKYTDRGVSLKEIISAKFLSPVLPSEEIACVCRGIQITEEPFVVKASVSRNGLPVSEMKLKISLKAVKNR